MLTEVSLLGLSWYASEFTLISALCRPRAHVSLLHRSAFDLFAEWANVQILLGWENPVSRAK